MTGCGWKALPAMAILDELRTNRPLHVMTADLNGYGQDEVIGNLKGLGLLMRYNDGNVPERKIGPVGQGVVAGRFD